MQGVSTNFKETIIGGLRALVSQEMIDTLLDKEVKFRNQIYRIIFEYTGAIRLDSHVVKAGFECRGREYTKELFIPSVREDSMLQRDHKLWYPVSLVIPPLHFNNYGSVKSVSHFLSSTLRKDKSASSMADFLPTHDIYKPQIVTRLMRMLVTKDPVDFHNMSEWIVIDTATAILEIFGMKVASDIERSQRAGWQGISASIKGTHALINSFTHYSNDEDEEMWGNDAYDDADSKYLKRIGVEDTRGTLYLHPLIKEVNLNHDTPIDFCSCSQSRPMITARIKDGVSVEGWHFKGKPTFPYARLRRSVPGILSDDPHRVIVSRSVTRAMVLEEPTIPHCSTEVQTGADSISLPGVRLTHPLTFEDGIIVSETFAKMAGAFKVYIDRITVPKNASVRMLKEQYDYQSIEDEPVLRALGDDEFSAAKLAAGIMGAKLQLIDMARMDKFTVKRGDKIAVVQFKNTKDEMEVQEVRASVKVPAIVHQIECIEPVNDTDEDMIRYKLVYLAYLPLEVGSKLSDMHGNKGTVSTILPDFEMPVWNGHQMHYVASPYVMKRLAVGAEIEDKLAYLGYCSDEGTIEIDSNRRWTLSEVDQMLADNHISTSSQVIWYGKTYENVPVSYRMMFRLDNNAAESLIIRNGVTMDGARRVGKNARTSLDVVTLLARGAANISRELIEKSGSKTLMNEAVIPIIHAINGEVPEGAETYWINKRIPRELLGNPMSGRSLMNESAMVSVDDPVSGLEIWAIRETPRDFTGTSADSQARTKYGMILAGKEVIVVPPHEPFKEQGCGIYIADSITVAANRVIAEVISCAGYGPTNTNVPGVIDTYLSTLAGVVGGKRGRLASALCPVYPKSIRAVASPFLSDNPFRIMLPKRAFGEIWKHSEDSFRELYRGKNMCLLKRDPVHRGHNIIGVEFGLWENNTIGISPLIISMLDGDFDGDALVAVFPETSSGYHDLKKLTFNFEDVFNPAKQLTGSTAKTALKDLMTNVGWSSTFRTPHATDELKNVELFPLLVNGMSETQAHLECLKAIKDFTTIKDGTARTGALGLNFIYTRPAEDAHLLEAACELYHVLAQNTLNAKSGTATPSLEVVRAFANGDVPTIKEKLAELGFKDEQCIANFLDFSVKVHNVNGERVSRRPGFNGIVAYLRTHYPVLAVVRRNATIADVEHLAQLLKENKSVGEGIFGTMLDYLLERRDKSPFDYVSYLDDAIRMARDEMSGSHRKTLTI